MFPGGHKVSRIFLFDGYLTEAPKKRRSTHMTAVISTSYNIAFYLMVI